MWRDRIQFADDDLGIAGMGRSIDSVDAAASGAVRTRRDQAPKPVKCAPRPGLTAAWTVVDDEFDPSSLLTPRQASALAILEYAAVARRLGIAP